MILKKYLKRVLSGTLAVGMLLASVPAYADSAINLSAVPNNEEDYIALKWNSPDAAKKFSYMIYSKKATESEFQSIPAKGEVKVLNVYPSIGDNLKEWMEEPNDEDGKGYGKGLISVDRVRLGKFNEDPESYLKDDEGNWKYDVVYEGAWDGNGGEELTDNAVESIREFINDGRGFLSGHDTYSFCKETNLIKDMSAGAYGDTSISISRKGLLTNYPWNIGDVGTNLSIPLSHVGFEYAFGDVWMKFNNSIVTDAKEINEYDGKECTNNFYLTTWNNCAMIQTGHSNGQATPDEQKVLANTLFYLAQITEETNWDDHKGQDVDGPTIPAINNVTVDSANNNVNVSFASSTDNGTTYNYYVEATDLDAKEKVQSDVKDATITSGLAGYSIVVDNNADTIPSNEITTTDTNYTVNLEDLDPEDFYIHVAAIDKVGNISSVSTYKYGRPSLTLSQDITAPTTGNVKITANAASESASIVEIDDPDGIRVDGDSAEFTAIQNGTYTFTAVDSNGLSTTESITISNIVAAPELTLTASTTEPTTEPVKITANAFGKDAEIEKIQLPDGTYVDGNTAEFTVSENGTYTFLATDSNGISTTESITISNIVVEPELTLTASTTEPTAEPVKITANAFGKDAEIEKIQLPDGTYVDGNTAEFTVSENGTYTFTAVDVNGLSVTKSIEVTNITSAPDVPEAPELTLTANTTEPTTESVKITANAFGKDAEIEKIQLPDGTYVDGNTAEFTVSENGTYTFTAVDVNGLSVTKSIEVTNITSAPDVPEAPELTLTASTTEPTTEPVKITANAFGKDAEIEKIQLPDGTYVEGNTAEFTVSENGTYTFTAVDVNGLSVTKSIEVTNITTVSEPKYVLNIEPNKNNVLLNENVTADLTIDNIKEIAAEDVRIKYDASKLQFLGITAVDGIKVVRDIENEGELRLILASQGAENIVNLKKTLVKLNFKAIAKGDALVDVTKGRVSDGIEMERDLLDNECGQATIVISDFFDVNRDGQFTLLDLAIDGRHFNENPVELPQYNTDIVEDGSIDDADLIKIGQYMIENPNYIF